MRQREVVRNLSDATQSIFLTVRLIQPVTATGEPIQALTLCEKRWTIVRSGTEEDESSGATLTVQIYHRITPEFISDGYKTFWTKDTLLERVVPMWNSSLGLTRRRLESYLIERGLRDSRGL